MNLPVTTIYLADDHQIIIDGLKLLISDESSMKIVGYANNGDTACEEIIVKKPDIALIDLRMPDGMSGLELIYKLTRVVKNTRFIILSMHDDRRSIKDALKGGAMGYLLKSTGKAELMKCLSTVLNGNTYFPTLPVTKPNSNKPIFTPREFEIVKLIIDEYTTPQIAEKLCLSKHTVDVHRKSICRKADTHTALGLAKFLWENHIEL